MHLADPIFPPLLDGTGVKSPKRPFALARAQAEAGRAGAGDAFWARSTATMDLAIVLEPEVVLERAVHMLFAAEVALGDALGTLAPPEVGVYYRWPGDIVVNGAKAGEVRFAVPDDAREGEIPRWLVVGVTVAIGTDTSKPDPGLDLDNTVLVEEGCGDVNRTDLIESFCRHFLVWIDAWEDEGFAPIHKVWLERAEKLSTEVTVGSVSGEFLGLDDAGNLLVKPGEGAAVLLSVLDHAVRGISGAAA